MFNKRTNAKKIAILVILVILISYIIISNIVSSRVYAAQSIEGYSSSKISKYPGYQALIDNLKSKHPNWNFKILYTGLDWNQVIKNETTASHGRNLVYSNRSGTWVCSTCGDKPYDTGKWRCASEVAVSYYMDPRNWINEDYIFQFEDLSYDANTQTLSGVQKILSSAAWANGSSIKYTKTDGTQGTINKSYAQVIMDASKEAGISAYHLASRIVLEQGKNSTPGSTAKGTYTGYQGYYNFCNVNASGNTSAAVISNALTYAKNNGWTDPEASIKGGAKFIAKSYIAVGQSTLYLQKYDVDNSDGKLYYHQYMANVSAASTECVSVKNSYSSLGMLNNNYTFVIPVYENMPNEVCASPDSTSIVTQNVKITGSNVQVRNSPSLIGTVVEKLNSGDVVLRIECAASQNDGYYWDKIVLKSGAKAYIARNYISQVGDVTNCNVSGVANTSANIRNGPGTTGTSIVTTLISGQAVTIIEKNVYNNLNGYNWVRVKLSNGTQGYIASQYITEVSGGNTNTNYKIATIVCEDGSSVRIRSGATTQGSIVTTLKKGATVTVMQENVAQANGYTWDKIVTSDGLEGYVANKYLNKAGNTTTQAPVAGKTSGDVNSNGKLDAGDYVLIKNHIMEVTTLTDAQKKLADYNSDGKVNASDYILIKNKLME